MRLIRYYPFPESEKREYYLAVPDGKECPDMKMVDGRLQLKCINVKITTENKS